MHLSVKVDAAKHQASLYLPDTTGVILPADASNHSHPKWKSTQDLETKRELYCCLFSSPLSHISRMCVCVWRQKSEKSSKEHHGNSHSRNSHGLRSDCFLINTDKPRNMFYIEHWLKVSPLTAWSFYLYQSILCSEQHDFTHNSVENCFLQRHVTASFSCWF